VWSFQPHPDGSLRSGEPFYRLETRDESSASGAGGMTVDGEGFLYVVTRQGIEVFDQAGRLNAIVDTAPGTFPSGLAFGGPDLDTLYLAAGDKVFRRHVRRKGVFAGQPARLPVPRL
jgi:gluconolactonase